MSITIKKKTSYANTSSYNNRPLKYIVIHYTAGSSSNAGCAMNTANMFSNPNIGASADFIVDDSTIVQFNPDIRNRYCWHCGDNKAYTKGGSYYGKCQNYNSIGIEICSTNPNWKSSDQANSSKWSFTGKAVKQAVELTKYLMEEYNISADCVIRHYDVSGKLCPGIIGWNADSGSESKWKNFKKEIGEVSKIEEKEETPKKAETEVKKITYPKTPFSVQVLIPDLNFRKSYSETSASYGYTGKGVFTIVEVKNDWGRLKSKGWIYLGNPSYVTIGKTITTTNKNTNTFKPYIVQVTASALNIRKGPSTSYQSVGVIKRNEKYTIVEEKKNWGKLKSGAGWICLDYVKKC